MTESKPVRFKFFNGPHVGTIQEGYLIKRTAIEDWKLQLENGDLLDVDAGVRMGVSWKDVELVSSSEEEAVFRPVFRLGIRGQKFSVPMEHLT